MTIESYVESKMDPEDLQDKHAELIRELQGLMQGYDNGTPISAASADELQFHERCYAPPASPAGGWIAVPADLLVNHCVCFSACSSKPRAQANLCTAREYLERSVRKWRCWRW
jgi:hypothetical protein